MLNRLGPVALCALAVGTGLIAGLVIANDNGRPEASGTPEVPERPHRAEAPQANNIFVANCLSVEFREIRPAEWSPGCTGASPLFRGLSWSDYDTESARGSGQVGLNLCRPDCASGRIFFYPAVLKLDGVEVCPHDENRAFYTEATIEIRYPRDNPFGEREGWTASGPFRVFDCM